MSRLFYDHLIIFEEIETILSEQKLSPGEKAKVNQMIEETIHHRVLTRILTHLPREHHQEFLERFKLVPYDEGILEFLKEKVTKIEDFIEEELEELKKELLEDIKS